MIFSLGSDILDGEDFEFREGDVVQSNVNGIPTIDFLERIQHLLVKDMVPLWDYEMVVFGHYLTVQPWIVDFNPSKAFPSVVLTWIRFPGLPGFLNKRKVLEQIWKFDKPLTSQVLINGKFQIIEFEALPAVCFAYGRYGHVKGSCHFEMVELNLPSKEEKTIPLTENVNGGGGFLRPLDDYRTEV
ncbi:hypothetical protein Gohar_004338 [Gossypium harknessii]|uniref:DUF4283 domain-containing protein n=1 Tax=Gossypium harknessii TaxID=34285 RepID=A0A7J9H4H5_9ROSI|nr:hypothetical protein [Gossypium harknessii]